jgi:hypothetical protein
MPELRHHDLQGNTSLGTVCSEGVTKIMEAETFHLAGGH